MRIFSALLSLLLLLPQLSTAQAVLAANPGPSNNGGGAGSAILFDLQATTGLVLTHLTSATDAAPGANYSMRIYTRAGTGLGGPVGAGAGSSPDGWSLLGTVTATQGAGEVSLPVAIPNVRIAAGQTVGMAVEYVDISQNYFGKGATPLETYANADLLLKTGDARSVPFTTTGSFFSSRALVGSIGYRLEEPVLPANPGPSDNSIAAGAGVFFDVQSTPGVVLTGMTTASQAAPNTIFQIEVYTRSGSALGNTATTGPAASVAGWTLRGTVTATQGADEISLPIRLPEITVAAGQTVGVGLRFIGAGPRYFGTGAPPYQVFSNPNLTLTSGDSKSAPFTTGGVFFTSRTLVGSLTFRPATQASLSANPGPSNNGGNAGTGMFMDLQADAATVVTAISTATSMPANGTFTLQVYTRPGSTLGGSLATGPTSSMSGWTLHTTVVAVQGATGEVSLPVTIPNLLVGAGQTVGVALVFPDIAPRYVGLGSGVPVTYGGSLLRVKTGEARTEPFTTGGAFFVSRELLGTVYFNSTDIIFRSGFE